MTFPFFCGGSGAYIKYLCLRLREAYHYELAVAAPDANAIHPHIRQFQIKTPQIPVFIGRPGLEEAKKYSELLPLEIAEMLSVYFNGTTWQVEVS